MSGQPRLAAFKILSKAQARGARLDILVSSEFEKTPMDERDKAFARELVHGVTRWRRPLDMIIEKAAQRPTSKMDPRVLNLLRMGLYQAVMISSTPPYAAVNETVSLARGHGRTRRAAGFVNAVLRAAIRLCEGDTLPQAVEKILPPGLPEHVRLGAVHSYPDWMAERWVKNFGAARAEAVMSEGNKRAPVFFRVNTLRVKTETAESMFERWGIEAERLPWAPDGYRLTGGKLTPASEPFIEGYIQPQDAASLAAASLLDPRPGDTGADVCCGRGVKSGAFAQWMGDRGMILSMDYSASKIGEFKANMGRLGVKSARAVLADASRQWPVKTVFNKIFLDAPCSATGTLRRHPEGKWSKTPDLIGEMAAAQRRMLETAADRLAPGGALVYSVCSIEPEEGPSMVEMFLSAADGLRLDDVRAARPKLAGFMDDRGAFRVFPGAGGMDGFYAARIVKDG